jgi:anti-sigma regulatory factor (Ser/Thr protein kinase)
MTAGAADATGNLGERARLSYWDGSSPNSLSLALLPPVMQCVELGLDGWLKTPRRRGAGQLSLLVSTRSAYRHPIGRRFVEAVEKRVAIDADLHDRIDIAVQEAVMNGVLHGNLQIDGGARDSLEGLDDVHASIERKLEQVDTARRMIQLDARWNAKAIQVVVRDNGAGYQRDRLPEPAERDASRPRGCGRGLSILDGVCDRIALIEGGTAIKMGFRR